MTLQQPIFQTLTSNDIRLITSFGKKRKFKKNSIIFFQDDDSDAFYYIESGRIKVLVLGQNGRVNLLRILGTGDYFGELGLLDNKPRSATVESIADTELRVVSRSQFASCLSNNKLFENKLIPLLTERIRNLTDELTISRVSDAYFGFRTQLYQFAVKQPDGTLLIKQKLTQQELGELVGTSRENINRFINELKKGGYIKKTAQGYWVILKSLPEKW